MSTIGYDRRRSPSSPERPLPYRVDDLLHHWRARGDIGDAQYRAGRRFEKLYGEAALGGHAAIDLSRPKVDGGSTVAGERRLVAREELESVRPIVGGFDFALLCRALGQGRGLEEDDVAQRRYLGRRMRDALSELAAGIV